MGGGGLIATLDDTTRRFIVRSPIFELSTPIELRFEASLSTFGARLYVCADDADASDLSRCELVLGPRVDGQNERILVQLDVDIRQFSFVAVHDKFEQFGPATFARKRRTKV